jgi:hypothetical protein
LCGSDDTCIKKNAICLLLWKMHLRFIFVI